jgi:hypothetical protein
VSCAHRATTAHHLVASLLLAIAFASSPIATAQEPTRPAEEAGDDATASLLRPEAELRARLKPLLPATLELGALTVEGSDYVLDGHAAKMTDVSTLLRSIEAEGGAVELMLIEISGPDRDRFQVRLLPSDLTVP